VIQNSTAHFTPEIHMTYKMKRALVNEKFRLLRYVWGVTIYHNIKFIYLSIRYRCVIIML